MGERPGKIEIYGRSDCPFTRLAVESAQKFLGRRLEVLPAELAPQGSRTPRNVTSVPVVVVDGVGIGGCEELTEYIRKKSLPRKSTDGGMFDYPSNHAGGCGADKAYGGAKKGRSGAASAKKPPRKLTAYAKFVKKFASDNKGMKGPGLMKAAGAKWRSMSDAEKARLS